MTSTDLAIELLTRNEKSLENKDAIQLLIDNGINYQKATEIITFLPIAFVRNWLTAIDWKDNYIEYLNGEYHQKRFSETDSYIQILEITKSYFKRNPNKEVIIKIAGRSAEFNVINKLLLENPNAKIEDIKLSDTVIVC
jgi:menaquinone-dependent protoporphyrinogen IX oxidase